MLRVIVTVPFSVPVRRSAPAERALVTYLAFKTYVYRGKELSDAMGYRDSSSVARSATRVEGSPALLRAWRRLGREVQAEFKDRWLEINRCSRSDPSVRGRSLGR